MVNPESKYDILYIILFRIERPFICSSLSYPQFQYIDSKVQTSTDFFLSLRTISHKMTIHKEEKKKVFKSISKLYSQNHSPSCWTQHMQKSHENTENCRCDTSSLKVIESRNMRGQNHEISVLNL